MTEKKEEKGVNWYAVAGTVAGAIILMFFSYVIGGISENKHNGTIQEIKQDYLGRSDAKLWDFEDKHLEKNTDNAKEDAQKWIDFYINDRDYWRNRATNCEQNEK